jgi:transposase InsO family protein
MPFEECSIVERRGEFCRLGSMPGANKRELCRRFGVSPQTGYKWLTRFAALGEVGLEDMSRRPLSSPSRTAEAIEARVLGVRHEHRAWGGRKIRRVLRNEGLAGVPSASTITEILGRHGLLDGPGAGEPRAVRRFEHEQPNDLWQMDFKGHIAMAKGRCHPLTMLDDQSRYRLELGACANERTLTVRERMTSVFRRHGLPKRILADNGSPWGTSGSDQRHTPLTVWLLDLEVPVSHGRPYHPQTQGKDERFHKTMKAEVLGDRVFDSLHQAWVEQKNGAVVQRIVGYRRLGGLAAAAVLGELYATVRLFVNFFQPSFKPAEKDREVARMQKRYHKPATPHQRLMSDPRTADDVKRELERVYAALDPVRLLRDMRAAQLRLAEIADAPDVVPADAADAPTLDVFRDGLRTSWNLGEVRPTARSKPKAKRGRRRPDPLVDVTEMLRARFEAEPWCTARELLEKLQADQPGGYPVALLWTLQRRLKIWRAERAREMVFGSPRQELSAVDAAG